MKASATIRNEEDNMTKMTSVLITLIDDLSILRFLKHSKRPYFDGDKLTKEETIKLEKEAKPLISGRIQLENNTTINTRLSQFKSLQS